MKYTICYEYLHWMCGCDCCSDSSSEISVHLTESGRLVKVIEYVDLLENEDELRTYIQENYPEFSDCVIDPESIWF